MIKTAKTKAVVIFYVTSSRWKIMLNAQAAAKVSKAIAVFLIMFFTIPAFASYYWIHYSRSTAKKQ